MECLQRDDWQGVFHLTLVERIAPVELEIVHVAVYKAQLSAPLEVDVVRLVGVQRAHDSRALLDVEHQFHVQPAQLRRAALYDRGRVAEVSECHNLAQPVVRAQGRVGEDVCQVGRSEHVELPSHAQAVERPADAAREVDESLAIGHRARPLLRVDQLVVLRPHLQFERHPCRVGEVYAAIDVEGAVVVRVKGEVLEEQVAAYDAHGVVVHSQAEAVGNAGDVRRVEAHLAVYLGRGYGPAHGELTVGIARESHQAVGYEAVDQRERQAVHVERGVKGASVLAGVLAPQQPHLVVVVVDARPDEMRGGVAHHVSELAADVTDVALLEREVAYRQVGHDGEPLLLVLYDVEVAEEQPSEARHEGHDSGYLVEVELVEADRYVLQRVLVFVGRVYLHARIVVGYEVHTRADPLVAAHEDVVVLVKVERLVAEYRLLGHQAHVDSAVAHLRPCPDVCAETVGCIVEPGVKPCLGFVVEAVEERGEGELRVVFPVGHLADEAHPRDRILHHEEAHGVNHRAVYHERIEVHIAVEAPLRRRVETEQEVVEDDSLGLQEIRERVSVAAYEPQPEVREQPAEAALVDYLLLALPLGLGHEPVHLRQHGLVAASGGQLQVEAAAAHHCPCCVGAGGYVHADVSRVECHLAALYAYVAHGAFQRVRLLHVGGEVEVGAEAGRERVVRQVQTVEVGVAQVGHDGGPHLGAA